MRKKKIWYLYPLSLIYGLITIIRNLLFDLKILQSKTFEIPIICIGNITVGGTGKTPHTEFLVDFLQEEFKIAVLSRGYKRKTSGFKLANENSKVNEIGDEPKQILNKFPKIKVAVDKNRIRGIKELLKSDKELKLILLDDGFQHRYVKAGLNILLIDYNRLIYEDNFLPYGELRESAEERKRAEIIIISKTPNNIKPIEQRIISKDLKLKPYQDLFFTYFEYQKIVHVFNKKEADFKFKELNIFLITGIADNFQIINYLQKNNNIIEHFTFEDHYSYKNNDIDKIISNYNELKENNENGKTIIITTEKDATRLQDMEYAEKLSKLPIYYLPINIKFINNDRKTFNKRVFNYLRKVYKDKSFFRL